MPPDATFASGVPSAPLPRHAPPPPPFAAMPASAPIVTVGASITTRPAAPPPADSAPPPPPTWTMPCSTTPVLETSWTAPPPPPPLELEADPPAQPPISGTNPTSPIPPDASGLPPPAVAFPPPPAPPPTWPLFGGPLVTALLSPTHVAVISAAPAPDAGPTAARFSRPSTSTVSSATNAIGSEPVTVRFDSTRLGAENTRIMTSPSTTMLDATFTVVMLDSVTTPVSVSIVDPAGIVIAVDEPAASKDVPRLFVGVNVPHETPSLPQPTVQVVTVVDEPSPLHVVTSPMAHAATPGVHPHRDTGQSVGVIVHTFLSPPEAGYCPSTSQNGYAGFVQSLSDVQPSSCFVHESIVVAVSAAQTESALIMSPLSTATNSSC
jgi:hypothetical protein